MPPRIGGVLMVGAGFDSAGVPAVTEPEWGELRDRDGVATGVCQCVLQFAVENRRPLGGGFVRLEGASVLRWVRIPIWEGGGQ